jgi:hypothetical protein
MVSSTTEQTSTGDSEKINWHDQSPFFDGEGGPCHLPLGHEGFHMRVVEWNDNGEFPE